MAVDQSPASERDETVARIPELASEAPKAHESRRSLHRMVWLLAWPSVITMLLQTANSFLDRFFVGRLGPDALAAVGLSGQLMFLLFSVGMSVSIGTTALVARFTGAKDTDDAVIAANQSLWIAGIGALLCIGLMMPARHTFISLVHIDPQAAGMCIQYLTITLLGIPALFFMLILGGVFRGIGDMVTPLIVMIGVNLVHLGGDYLLIFGNAGFPKLGLTGGALSLVASQVLGAILYGVFLRKTPLHGVLTRKASLELAWAKRILNIGLPAAMQNISRVLSMLAFTAVLGRTPQATAAVAALTIGLTSESIAFMPGFAFSTAASTLTGQNLGAGDPRRAERAAWVALQQGLGVMMFMGALFYLCALPFAHIFTHDPQVVALTVAYLKISALSEPLLAFGMILTGALNGAGETRGPAWLTLITMWGIRLPLAYFLAHLCGFGAVGAWWAMAASTILSGLGALALFKWGHWKKTVV